MLELAYIYARVSGQGQADGDGITRQLNACWEFCRGRFHVADECREIAVSGTIPGMSRPGFSDMIVAARDNGIRNIVVERADRLARDLIESELILRELSRHGIRVWCADSGQDLTDIESDPTRKLIRQIMGALAEWDKSVLVHKLRSARQRKRVSGERCEGRKPYNNPEVCQEILDLRRHGATWNFISAYLQANQRPSPHSVDGSKWTPRSVKRIYKRETKACQS